PGGTPTMSAGEAPVAPVRLMMPVWKAVALVFAIKTKLVNVGVTGDVKLKAIVLPLASRSAPFAPKPLIREPASEPGALLVCDRSTVNASYWPAEMRPTLPAVT